MLLIIIHSHTIDPSKVPNEKNLLMAFEGLIYHACPTPKYFFDIHFVKMQHLWCKKNLEVLRCDSCMITDPNKLFIEINSNYTTKSYHSYYWIHITWNICYVIRTSIFIYHYWKDGIKRNFSESWSNDCFLWTIVVTKKRQFIVVPIEIGHFHCPSKKSL